MLAVLENLVVGQLPVGPGARHYIRGLGVPRAVEPAPGPFGNSLTLEISCLAFNSLTGLRFSCRQVVGSLFGLSTVDSIDGGSEIAKLLKIWDTGGLSVRRPRQPS